jgi:hypothetical protein
VQGSVFQLLFCTACVFLLSSAPMTMRDLHHANRLVQAIVEAIVMT